MILERIKAGTKNRTTIRWPGSESEVTLRVLSKDELHQATFQAHHHFKRQDIPVATHTIETFKDEETIQILYRALRGTGEEADKPLSSSIDSFRALVSMDEISELADAYEAFQNECSPSMEKMSGDEFERLLAELKKKPEMIVSSVSSIGTLRRLLLSLAAPQAS